MLVVQPIARIGEVKKQKRKRNQTSPQGTGIGITCTVVARGGVLALNCHHFTTSLLFCTWLGISHAGGRRPVLR